MRDIAFAPTGNKNLGADAVGFLKEDGGRAKLRSPPRGDYAGGTGTDYDNGK